MSLSIEVIQENQLPIMENLEEQEIKEIEKIEKIFSFSKNYSFRFVRQPNLETHADRVIKIAESPNLKAYAAELSKVFKAFDDEFDDKFDERILLQKYDDAIAEMKRKSKMKKGSHPSFKVINIEGEDKAIEGDPEIRIQKKHPKQDHTVWATFFSSEIAMACCLGNPLDKLYNVESTGKVKEQSLINFGKAVSVYAPCITLTAIFFTNFIYTAILTRPLAFRVHANSMLLLLFMYYILALAEALSGYGVALGSTEVPALMFVCGGAIGPMLLMGSIIMGLKSVFKNQIPSKIG